MRSRKSKRASIPKGVDRLLRFKGYGDPSAPYWFVGIEERGDGSDHGLRVRSSFCQFEDLARAHAPDMLNFPMDTLIPTWATMSKIVMRIEGHKNWKKREEIRRYQSRALGRKSGDLTDLLPLPAEDTDSWHYRWLYPTRDEYEQVVLPKRGAMLGRLLARNEPRYVFCYGKGYWGEFERVFPQVEFQDVLGGKLRLGRSGRSTIVLTPFFFYYTMTSDLIERMVQRLQR